MFTTQRIFLILFLFGTINYGHAQQKDQKERYHQLLDDIRLLSSDSLQGRYTGSKGGEMARAYIIDRLQQIGVSAYVPNYRHEFSFYSSKKQDTLVGQNILGLINGTEEAIIVISAHYDHLGLDKNGQVFNGADDNASGVAALLYIAAYFAENEPNSNLLFAFFDGEEHGKRGAFAFINSVIADTFNIKLNINLDMISRNDKGELYASGTYHYPFLKPYIQQLAGNTTVKIMMGHDNPKSKQQDWTQSSDHAAFHKVGIPYIYFGVEDHADYHKVTDDFDKIQVDFYTRAAETILKSVLIFDQNIDTIKNLKK